MINPGFIKEYVYFKFDIDNDEWSGTWAEMKIEATKTIKLVWID